jgi:hypothetical protein
MDEQQINDYADLCLIDLYLEDGWDENTINSLRSVFWLGFYEEGGLLLEHEKNALLCFDDQSSFMCKARQIGKSVGHAVITDNKAYGLPNV